MLFTVFISYVASGTDSSGEQRIVRICSPGRSVEIAVEPKPLRVRVTAVPCVDSSKGDDVDEMPEGAARRALVLVARHPVDAIFADASRASL